MRIGMVCFPTVGGSGTLAVALAAQLEKRGHEVTLIARERPARMRDDTPFVPIEPTPHALFDGSPYTVALARTLLLEAKKRSLDVVHLHYGVPHAASAMLLRQAMGAGSPAIVVTVHGTDVTGFGADAGHAPILAAALRAADVVTAPSRFLADRAREALAIECEVVPNFVDTDVFRPTMSRAHDGPVRLVHVSSFRPVKATRSLVPMMRALGREAHLTLVGDGPDRAQVEADAREARLGSCVEFLGAIRDPGDVAEILSEADLFVLPSESESFGLAALEALACAVPVIARRVGGLPEVVRDGVTGVLVDRVEDFAPAIHSLSPERRIEMAMEASTDTRRRFAPEVVVGRYEAVYERAIRARRGESDA